MIALNRRRFLKYAGATAAIVGASALGLDDLLSPQQGRPSRTASSAASSSISSYTSSSYASTSVVESTSSTLPLSTLSDLDDPKSGYPDLANELRKLPEFHQDTQENKIAVQRIATLALQSNDPEVEDGFKIILRGGNSWGIPLNAPDWNTGLQALFWLGAQNEFGKNDTLAQAIAIVNGLWVSIANQDVAVAVRQDISELLQYFRDLNDFQRTGGYLQLESYPLEAKLLLSWTGNVTQVFGPHSLVNSSSGLDLRGYRWNTVSVDTLRKMRSFSINHGWLQADVNGLAFEIESYLRYLGSHWQYVTIGSSDASMVSVDGESTLNYHIGNVDFQFDRLSSQGTILGDCVDQSGVVDAFLKASGIATTFIQKWRMPTKEAHMNSLFYNPSTQGVTGITFQLENVGIANGQSPDYAIYFPPIKQRGYLDSFASNNLVWYYKGFTVPANTTRLELFQEIESGGFPIHVTRELDAQWLGLLGWGSNPGRPLLEPELICTTISLDTSFHGRPERSLNVIPRPTLVRPPDCLC